MKDVEWNILKSDLADTLRRRAAYLSREATAFTEAVDALQGDDILNTITDMRDWTRAFDEDLVITKFLIESA